MTGERAAASSGVAPLPPIDVTLLEGFGFACLPGCGLCCFASPRLEADDEGRLRTVVPDARVVFEGGERRLAARADGGACQLLVDLRCRAHDVRPAPCREFPVSVHIGTRLQATVVLSCPGVHLSPLLSVGGHEPLGSGAAFARELASVRRRLTPRVERQRVEAERRQRRIARELSNQGRWQNDEDVRRELGARALIPGAEEYRLEGPPAADDGLEFLPMYYDGRPGPIAIAQGLGGWEAHELSPEGGSRPIGLAVPPEQPPSLDPDAATLLSAFLRYWLSRDCFLAAVHLELVSYPQSREGTVVEAALDDLHAIGSYVLACGAFRSKLNGKDGNRLSVADVEHGIRATDQDWLDRPTWGSRL